MAIIISDDLNINVVVNSVDTKTIDNHYDPGTPGTYLPGIDCSPTDDVSVGVTTSYQIGISLSSKTNQNYPIDKLFLQSADDPQTDGTGKIPFYLINSDPNPENTTDDGLYTIFPGYTANMTSVVLGPDAGITSTSTINLTLNINYPDGVYWKTKIAPKIYVNAVKDGITQKSNLLRPEEVKMSSTADIQNDLFYLPTEWGGIRLTTQNGQQGFLVPFYLKTDEIHPANLAILLDSPNPDTITYKAHIDFTIEGNPIPLNISQIKSSLQSGLPGVTIQNVTLEGDLLTVTLKRNGNMNFPVVIRTIAFLPFTPADQVSVTMRMNASWDNPDGVIFDNWVNRYIFKESTTGGYSASQVIPLKFTIPPTLSDTVSGIIQPPNTSISSNFTFSNLDFISIQGSQMLLLYDSPVATISDADPKMEVIYTPLGGTTQATYNPPNSDFTQQYAYVPLTSGYNPNTIAQEVFNKTITVGSYQEIVAAGHKPNVLVTTVLADILAGLDIDYSKTVTINYQNAKSLLITNDEFYNLYQANPSADYTGHLYTVMQIGTNFASVADANAKYGSLLGTGDSFKEVGNKVYLYLATNPIGSPMSIRRFNLISTVRADIPIPSYKSYFQTSLSYDGINTITNIFDYTKTYPLRFSIDTSPLYLSAPSQVLANTKITFAIPSGIEPYLYLAGQPAVYSYNSQTGVTTLVASITDYSLNPGSIQVTIPQDITFSNTPTDRTYLEVPVRFIAPAQNVVFTQQDTTYDPSQFLLAYPNQIVTGFPSTTPYYDIQQTYVNTTLQGAGVDFSGLTVNKNYYPSGTPVTYIATIKNQSNVADDFYMALTVPTNQYNPLETSNNSQPAFINRIIAFYPGTDVYYQTAAKATALDIQEMKELTPPTNLKTYYNTVITSTWTKYQIGDPLPSDVVMVVAHIPSLPAGEIGRVDYDVTVQMDPNTTETYINDAAFNYYSNASGLETQSNKVTIQNYNPKTPIVINKSPETQTVGAQNGKTADFTITFVIPQAAQDYTTLTFLDQLPKALNILSTSTIQVNQETPTPLNATVNTDKLVSVSLENPQTLAGKTIKIVLHTTVDDIAHIPDDGRDTNQARLVINGDPALTFTSNTVNVVYEFDNIFNIQKSPATQQLPKTLDTNVNFSITFNVPQDISAITSLILTDSLDPSLSFNPTNSFLQIGSTPLGILPATISDHLVTVNLDSYITQAAGQTVKITLGATLTHPELLPEDNTIDNRTTLTVNNIPAYSFTSNTVTVTFTSVSAIPIRKGPLTQQVDIVPNAPVAFTLIFTLPTDLSQYQSLTVNDILDPTLAYDNANSTIQFGTSNPIPIDATVNDNTVTKTLTDFTAYAGMDVVIKLAATLAHPELIPANSQIMNIGTLTVNNNPALISTSNEVNVTFIPRVIPIPITKAPSTQQVDAIMNQPVNFTLTFTLPQDVSQYQSLTFEDILAPSLTYNNTNSTIQFGTASPVTLDATVTGQTVTKNLINIAAFAGMNVTINLATTLTHPELIPANNQITNTATLAINSNPALTSTSNEVTVTFIPHAAPIPITKAPLIQHVEIIQNTPIIFTSNFTLPQNLGQYNILSFSDTLHPSLAFDSANSTIQFGNEPAMPLNAIVNNNTVTRTFILVTSQEGAHVTIKLATKLAHPELIPTNNQITNIATLIVNNDPTLTSTSNQVTVIFTKVNPHQPAINDVIESVALQQTALSHILNAEGEKIQKAMQLEGITDEQLLSINDSVASTINSITHLESLLTLKLQIVDCGCPKL